jgi:hypothetical protein
MCSTFQIDQSAESELCFRDSELTVLPALPQRGAEHHEPGDHERPACGFGNGADQYRGRIGREGTADRSPETVEAAVRAQDKSRRNRVKGVRIVSLGDVAEIEKVRREQDRIVRAGRTVEIRRAAISTARDCTVEIDSQQVGSGFKGLGCEERARQRDCGGASERHRS